MNETLKRLITKFGHEKPEGSKFHYGINYWFPQNSRTEWVIAVFIPLFFTKYDMGQAHNPLRPHSSPLLEKEECKINPSRTSFL
jgi:hypothetical protein